MARWTEVFIAGYAMGAAEADAWRRIDPILVRARGYHHVVAALDGRDVAASAMFVRRRVAALGPTVVLPEARGRGIQRALIVDRARRAAAAGARHDPCDRRARHAVGRATSSGSGSAGSGPAACCRVAGPEPAGRIRRVTDLLRVERSGPNDAVARVTLARPDVHNAFNASLIAELRQTFTLLGREGPTDLRVVVLAGDGPSFCAGADIDWMRAAMRLDVEANEQDAMAFADTLEAIDTCPVPVIARVHGPALGGGSGLCAVSDLVIAEAGAKFGFTETRLGILPAVISPFVIAKIGESHARALFPGGRRFDAIRAQRIGLVHEVVEGVDALDAAVDQAVADVLASGSDRRPGGEGDRSRGARARPRLVEVAHRPGDRPPARVGRGPGGLRARSSRSVVPAGRRIRTPTSPTGR